AAARARMRIRCARPGERAGRSAPLNPLNPRPPQSAQREAAEDSPPRTRRAQREEKRHEITESHGSQGVAVGFTEQPVAEAAPAASKLLPLERCDRNCATLYLGLVQIWAISGNTWQPFIRLPEMDGTRHARWPARCQLHFISPPPPTLMKCNFPR